MANPLACAAANASLDLFEARDWRGKVARIARGLGEGLEPCRSGRGVTDVRVMGAVGVVEFEHPVDVKALCARFRRAGRMDPAGWARWST